MCTGSAQHAKRFRRGVKGHVVYPRMVPVAVLPLLKTWVVACRQFHRVVILPAVVTVTFRRFLPHNYVVGIAGRLACCVLRCDVQ